MTAKRIIALICLAAGIILLIFGVNASQSIAEEAMEGVTGRFTSTTMAYIISGVVLVLLGGGLFICRGTQCKK